MKPNISRPTDHEILAERLGFTLAAYFQKYPSADWLGMTFPPAIPVGEIQMVAVSLKEVGFHSEVGDTADDGHRLVVLRFKP